jgi:hypothetical protein
MEPGELCIQSFAPHRVEFMDKGLAAVGVERAILSIPAGSEKDNYVIAQEALIVELSKDPTFKGLIEAKVIRILPTLPEKYANPIHTLNAVRSSLVDTTKALSEEKEKVASLASENGLLKARIAELENGNKIPEKTVQIPEEKAEGGA